MAEEKKIDFVVIWVDGNDPAWQKERAQYDRNLSVNEDNQALRYRDWDNMRYWFRGVEKYCPWVNRVHFVTWGHYPKWLNIRNPKLNVVNHKDYIPKQYLPTFSSHTIELNLHRIEGLTEQFVYFNDDMFITNHMMEKDFFVDGKPCDSAILTIHCYDMKDMFIMAPFRDIGIINHAFSMRSVIKENVGGWFNVRYGIQNLRNLFLLACPKFPGMLQQHLPASYLKGTFLQVWERYGETLNETCLHKFREISDVNQWVFKEWQLASGSFYPRKPKIGKLLSVNNPESVCAYIRKQNMQMLCLNDAELGEAEFEEAKMKIIQSFESILPEKSSFEI